VDAIALSVMSPAWIAMDAKGKPLTPIVTHQDRRSVAEAHELERKLGDGRYLAIAGTRPFPGGISSTTWAWYLRNEPQRLRKADLVGHLNTYLHRQLTGSRVVDTANASFMGVYSTVDFGGWSEELCAAVGLDRSQLPDVHDANEIGGRLTREATHHLGLAEGTPMVVGIVDGSAGMLMAGARPGQMLNVCGSTDVLALCADRAVPHERLLTRALGVGRLWLSVSTIAAAGSAVAWAKDQFFADWTWPKFQALAHKLAMRSTPGGTSRHTGKEKRGRAARASRGDRGRSNRATDDCVSSAGVCFEPYLAGDRMSIDQKQGAFTGLTLGTTREDLLAAILESLAQTSAARVTLLRQLKLRIRREVIVTGGAQRLDAILHRDWPGTWTFRHEQEATLRGLAMLEPQEAT
jgi:xylulokinase